MDDRQAIKLAARIVRKWKSLPQEEEEKRLLRRIVAATSLRSRRGINYAIDRCRVLITLLEKRRDVRSQVPDLREKIMDLSLLLKSGSLTYDHRNKVLVHDLGNIVLTCDDGDVNLGSWELRFPIRCMCQHDIRAICTEGGVENDGYLHPHVSDGCICFGEASLPCDRAVKELRLLDAIELCRSVLLHYSSENPYRKLEEWLGVSGCFCGERASLTCHECGTSSCSDCGGTCNCGNEMCENHIWYCDDCGSIGCGECMRSCNTCDRTICPDCEHVCYHCGSGYCGQSRCGGKCHDCGCNVCRNCLSECDACGDTFCSSCLDDGKCSECREAEQEQEEEEEEEEEETSTEESEEQPTCA